MFAAIVRHGILVSVAVLILMILGLAAIWRIPVQMIPDLEVRTIGVENQWPGATPQDIEKDILIEQEEYLRNVPALTRMEATARSGSAEIEMEFPFGVDLTETLIRVNNALSQVPSYPVNVDQPRIVANSFSANAFMYFNVAPREGNPRELYRGVGAIVLFGLLGSAFATLTFLPALTVTVLAWRRPATAEASASTTTE